MFTFTPLLGAKTTSPAVQSLLEFDGGIKILIDVGWDVTLKAEALKELEKQVPTISIILLTHASLAHVGAYAHCCKHIPLFKRIPVYATLPVISLTRTLLQDLYASTPLAASFIPESSLAESAYGFSASAPKNPNILLSPPTPREIEEYLKLANQLKYLQPHQPIPSPFSPPLDGLTITAYCAGHSLGGTIWQIQHASESVVYAVDWHQARENVFPGAAWLSGTTGAEIVEQLKQPTALICSSKGADTVSISGGRQQRDEQLLSKIRSAVGNGGSVLIPCDTSARVLELAYFLDRAWAQDKTNSETLRTAKLYLASTTSSLTMRYARSMLEWMDESIVREFEASNTAGQGQTKSTRPFEFHNLKLLERKSQVERVLNNSGPKVILASDSSLEWGFSRDIFQTFAAVEKNLVILTSPNVHSMDGTILHNIADVIQQTSKSSKNPNEVIQFQSQDLQMKRIHTSPLTGQDQAIYQQFLARQRQRHNTTVTVEDETLDTAADAVDEHSESSSSSEEESDNEHQGKALNVSAALTHSKNKLGLTDEELGINVLIRRKNIHDFDVRGRKGRDKVFPFVAKRRRNDAFGDLIRADEFLRAEERDEVDGQDMGADVTKETSAVGRKRKWGDVESSKTEGRRRSSAGLQRKQSESGERANNTAHETNGINGAGDDQSESEESDYEPAEAVVQGPMKASFTTEHVQLKNQITSVDFSGIHDQRSLQMLIPLIKPRKLILTGGTNSETNSLANTCRSLLTSSNVDTAKEEDNNVFTPGLGETVDASVDTNAWTIKLSRKLFKQLQWQTFRNLGIVTINGKLELVPPEVESGSTDSKRQKIEETEASAAAKSTAQDVVAEDSSPILTDLPLNVSGPARLNSQPLHVGDLRLAELRKIMQSSGHTAEFKGEGTLLVDGVIAVRKSGIGKIEVESGGFALPGVTGHGPMGIMTPGASFYDVKRKIYEGLAVVAAR